MRVALVTPLYPPHVGGVEHHVAQLAQQLAAAGDEVTVLTVAGRVPPTQAPGVVVRSFPTVGSEVLALPRGLVRHLRRADYDVVHAHNYHSLMPPVAALAVHDRLVVTLHYHGRSASAVRDVLLRAYRPLGRRSCARARRLICVSEAERSRVLADLRLPSTSVDVIPNGVDIGALRAAEPWPVDRPVVLVLGRLEPYKRVDRVVSGFLQARLDADLVVVGDGPHRQDLEQMVRDAAADGVRFLGRLTDQEVRRWLATARVVVSLSELEAFGLVLLEGAVAGANVVASDIPAHREVAETLGGAVRIVPASAGPTEVGALLAAALDAPPPGGVTALDWSDVARRTRAVYADVVAG